MNVTVTIRGSSYELSPRKAVDVLALGEVAERGVKSGSSDLAIIARGVSDSLRATQKRLGPFRSWRYRRYTGFLGIRHLFSDLDPVDIMDLWMKVLAVEGKKKAEMEERHQAKS